jgi:hypothetical protein
MEFPIRGMTNAGWTEYRLRATPTLGGCSTGSLVWCPRARGVRARQRPTEYDIFEEEGERVGQQYPTDTGPLDILAIRKDKRELLVVELKKGRASDAIVGQILRYMGFVIQELAEEGQTVRGVIIALEDDQRIRRALTMTPNIAFYRYQISFKLLTS